MTSLSIPSSKKSSPSTSKTGEEGTTTTLEDNLKESKAGAKWVYCSVRLPSIKGTYLVRCQVENTTQKKSLYWNGKAFAGKDGTPVKPQPYLWLDTSPTASEQEKPGDKEKKDPSVQEQKKVEDLP